MNLVIRGDIEVVEPYEAPKIPFAAQGQYNRDIKMPSRYFVCEAVYLAVDEAL